jgi:hypothetical protein
MEMSHSVSYLIRVATYNINGIHQFTQIGLCVTVNKFVFLPLYGILVSFHALCRKSCVLSVAIGLREWLQAYVLTLKLSVA